jgi:fructose-bisphosphate aldolase class I
MSLKEIASKMVTEGKGILAADESTGTCDKRFDSVGIEKTEENRRLYREMLFTAADIDKFIGGVILFEETLNQEATDGIMFPELLLSRDILPGIKVDKGLEAIASSPEEKHTNGLDGLSDRLKEYAEKGAKFAKWRAVISIKGNELPTESCVRINAKELAEYALLCQKENIVPIVEPEVLIDGDHTIERCQEVTEKTLTIVFEELEKNNVDLSGIVLKPSMVIAGKDCSEQAQTSEVAEKTVETLKKCVPTEVPGIAFLSGGQTEKEATENLNAMNKLYPEAPWKLTFSYGRALQASALEAFSTGDIKKAQDLLKHRAQMNSDASVGEYKKEEEF